MSQFGTDEVDPNAGLRRQDLNSETAFNAEPCPYREKTTLKVNRELHGRNTHVGNTLPQGENATNNRRRRLKTHLVIMEITNLTQRHMINTRTR